MREFIDDLREEHGVDFPLVLAGLILTLVMGLVILGLTYAPLWKFLLSISHNNLATLSALSLGGILLVVALIEPILAVVRYAQGEEFAVVALHGAVFLASAALVGLLTLCYFRRWI